MNRFFRKIQVSLILCLACMMLFIPSALAGETWCESIMGSSSESSDAGDYACVDSYAPAWDQCDHDDRGLKIQKAAKTLASELGWSSHWTDGTAWNGIENWDGSVFYEAIGLYYPCTGVRGFSDSELVYTKEIDGIKYKVYD